jgi:hypothetical protein
MRLTIRTLGATSWAGNGIEQKRAELHSKAAEPSNLPASAQRGDAITVRIELFLNPSFGLKPKTGIFYSTEIPRDYTAPEVEGKAKCAFAPKKPGLSRRNWEMCCPPCPARLVETSRSYFLRDFYLFKSLGLCSTPPADQFAGSGNNAILRNIAANRVRVKCPSASISHRVCFTRRPCPRPTGRPIKKVTQRAYVQDGLPAA